MKYEFFFFRASRKSKPRIYRAIASSREQARRMLARRYGIDLELTGKTGKQALDSLRIHEIEVENVLIGEGCRETAYR